MFFLIDKPLGISSFDVIRELRRTLGIRKIGHTGTLDPLATGLMIVATGNSTKLIPLFDDARKEYIFTVRLDGKSESYDMGTPVFSTDMTHREIKTKESIVQFLLNTVSQIPPKYSALHIAGNRAYDLARKGVEFTILPRPIQVYEADILDQTEREIAIRMILSSGGYVRSFAPLLGEFLGVEGGYISSLRRTKSINQYISLNIEQAGMLAHPENLEYNTLFSGLLKRDISETEKSILMTGGCIEEKETTLYKNDDKILFHEASTDFYSLCIYKDEIWNIIKNNV